MKKYILGAVLAFGIIASPAFTQAAELTSSQVQAILGLLTSFGADSATIANVKVSLTGGTPAPSGPGFCYKNSSVDLTVGSTGSRVSELNQALSSSGIDISGLTTTFDENTAAAVVQFQAKYGIRQTGYVGPMTRAKLNSLYGCSTLPPLPMDSPTLELSATPSTVASGQSATISWSSTNANKCTAYENGSPAQNNPELVSTSGSRVQAFTETKTYTFTCGGPNGSVTKSVTVTVTPTQTSVPTITVTSPNGGEQFAQGSTHAITWTSSGLGSTSIVQIKLMNSANRETGLFAYSMANTGTYNWTVSPYVPAGSYRIQVTGGGSSVVSDSSDAPFYVVATTSTVGLVGGTSQTASALNALDGNQAQSSFSYVWNRDLQIGSLYFADVSALQTALTNEGVYTSDVTGGFYSQTFAAVKAFQQKYGIDATGYVGSQTRAKLNELY